MKPFIIVIFFLFAGNFLEAQTLPTTTISATKVPEVVKATFSSEFPTLQPKWETDDKNYKAIYADPKTNSKGIIVYDPSGKVIRRDIEVTTDKGPQ
ncbi:MAG: hypothetical protein V4506_16920 [Bacteroidota bacterium]